MGTLPDSTRHYLKSPVSPGLHLLLLFVALPDQLRDSQHFSIVMKKFSFSHPFWHLALAGWIAHALIWPNTHALDYPLMFVIPALLAFASTEKLLSLAR